MSIYIDSLIIFILCAFLYPPEMLNAFHIMLIALIFSLYCFENAAQETKWLNRLGTAHLVLCFFVPELSVFLPGFYYIFFYRKQYLLPYLYCMPISLYIYRSQSYVNLLLFPLAALSFYLAYQNRSRKQLQQTIKELRDNSVEREMLLKQHNTQLIESQNDQIYIATLKERNRIAREIHDNVGHMLTRSILQTGAILSICRDETIKPHLDALKSSLNEAMNSIRNSVHDLHDEAIDLKEALTGLIEHFTFCPIQFDCEISEHIPREIKYCFLSITKEALNNVIKHSNATKVIITVKEHPGFYQLLIEDNGTIQTNFSENNSGIGLTNMQDRVRAIHGIIHISNEIGFRIFVSVQK